MLETISYFIQNLLKCSFQWFWQSWKTCHFFLIFAAAPCKYVCLSVCINVCMTGLQFSKLLFVLEMSTYLSLSQAVWFPVSQFVCCLQISVRLLSIFLSLCLCGHIKLPLLINNNIKFKSCFNEIVGDDDDDHDDDDEAALPEDQEEDSMLRPQSRLLPSHLHNTDGKGQEINSLTILNYKHFSINSLTF